MAIEDLSGAWMPEKEEPIAVEELNRLDRTTVVFNPAGTLVESKVEAAKHSAAQKELPKMEEKTKAEITEIIDRKAKAVMAEYKEEIAVLTDKEANKVKLTNLADIAKKSFLIADFVIEKDNDNSLLYWYNRYSGLYEEASGVVSIIGARTNLSAGQKGLYRQLYNQIKLRAKEVEWLRDGRFIPVANGIFNLRTKELLPFSEDIHITQKIATSYNPTATNVSINNWSLDKWLKSIMTDDIKKERLLLEIVQEACNANDTRRKIVFFTGSGLNGKGTFQQLLENLIGKKHISHIKPDKMSGAHDLHAMAGKILNIGDDIDSRTLSDVSTLKTVASGDTIQINPKGRDLYSTQIKALNIFSANKLPKANDKTRAWIDRLIILPFNAELKGKANSRIKTDYIARKEVLEYLLFKALSLGEFHNFTQVESVDKAIKEYEEENNVFDNFVREVIIARDYKRLKVITPDLVRRLYHDFSGEHVSQATAELKRSLDKLKVPCKIKVKALNNSDRLTYEKYRDELALMEKDYIKRSAVRMVVF